MHHIVYLSRATHPFSDAALQDLLSVARQHNEALGITGLLLYGNNQFLQVVEGPEADVQALYEHIRQDPRHQDVTTFANKAITERAFPEWSMAFQPLVPAQFSALMGYVSPDSLRLDQPQLSFTDQQLLQLLRSFVSPEAA